MSDENSTQRIELDDNINVDELQTNEFECDNDNEILRSSSNNNQSLSLSNDIDSNNISVLWLAKDTNSLRIACANARSIVQKIGSLITLFEECDLHIALLTETWLTQKHCSTRTMNDLMEGANISFIRRDRGTRGGGVAICYNPCRIQCLISQLCKMPTNSAK